MKKFTVDEIKRFCSEHYGEYLNELGLVILFEFIAKAGFLRMAFADLVHADIEVPGLWQYVGYDMLADNTHVFKFKRAA